MKITQKDMVLSHLRTNGSITSWETIKEYGATRLSAIIFDLQKLGHRIDSEMVQSINRFGSPVSFKKYKLLNLPKYLIEIIERNQRTEK